MLLSAAARFLAGHSRAVMLTVALLAVYVLWGSNYVSIKIAVTTMPPFPVLALRWAVAGALLFALAAPRGDRRADPLGPRQWRATLALATLLIGFGNGSLFFAEQYVSSAVAALLAGTMPIWAALIEAFLQKRPIPLPTAAGLALGIVGLGTLLDPHAPGGLNPLAVGVGLAGSVLWAFGSVIAPRLAVPKRPLVSAAMQMLWVAAIFAVVAAVTGEWPRAWATLRGGVPPAFVAAFVWLIFFPGLGAFCSYLWLLRNAPLTVANSYAFVNPAIAVVLGAAMLGEPLTMRFLAGSAIVVIGVTLIVLTPRTRTARL